jgi:hypothetical protein
MLDTTTGTLTGEEVAIAKTAIRVIRALTAVGVAIAIPIALIFALPLVSYTLLAGVLVAPVVIGVVLFKAARQHVPQAG